MKQNPTGRSSADLEVRSARPAGTAGFSLIEVLTATLLLLFSVITIFNVFTITTLNTSIDRCRINAMNEARRKLEWVHTLSYDALGIGTHTTTPPFLSYVERDLMGNPGYTAGVDLPLHDTVAIGDGIVADRWVLVQAVDDSLDGTDTADTDKQLADYKKVTIRLRWTQNGQQRELSLSSLREGTTQLELTGRSWKTTRDSNPGGQGVGVILAIDPETDSLLEP